MRALSIRQPWAWLIVNGHKDIENRDWSTSYRGQFLVHAGKAMSRSYYENVADYLIQRFAASLALPPFDSLDRGGVIGLTTIVDCVQTSESLWFMGAHGFVLRDSRPLPFHPCNGQLGFFDIRLPA